ncbi:MAG TPA: isoaspartyl peptidase/L-asparaginase [Acidimicrobiales bacterium]|nr:isoaspartyl peptidase/L-asparaginase [Acidimicrobiales bacterium]
MRNERAPVIIGSERSDVGLPAAWEVLSSGGSALDAVETAIRAVEANVEDHYVGVGGMPNALGVVELDASLSVGSTRRFAAVAALAGYPHPISVARAILERLPQHCLLVGEGAARFAHDEGFERAELLTDESRRLFEQTMAGADDGTERDQLEGVRTRSTPGDLRYRERAIDLMRRLAPHDGPWGTVNVIALDSAGEIVAGVSTSGYPYKYPGRVGDSALPGAGAYADARGAAACTGRGEMAMRVGAARTAVERLEGLGPLGACHSVLADAATLDDPFAAELRVLILTADGRHAGASLQPGATYFVMDAAAAEPRLIERSVSGGN